MHAVQHSLDAMGVVQYLLAFVFLASYALALGRLVGTRGRRISLLVAAVAAIAFAARTQPWEHGVMLTTVAVVAVGLFAGAAWALWALLGWTRANPAAFLSATLRRMELRHESRQVIPLSVNRALARLWMFARQRP